MRALFRGNLFVMGISMEQHHCYAVRRLNPFQGVMQIIKSKTARAITIDGVTWEIQIKTKRPDDMWGAPSASEPITQFLRFGTWSSTGGLSRVPAHPLLDLTVMFREADSLIALITNEQKNLPFSLADRYEFWLLDGRKRMPLALISAATSADKRQATGVPQWRCADRSYSDFVSPEWDEDNPKHPKDSNLHPHMSALERQVRIEAGHTLCQWFERAESGTGKGLALDGFAELSGRELGKPAFPELMLREDCTDLRLVSSYLHWISPYLLTLQQLSDRTRKRLEQQARNSALLVDRNWKLYPKVIDPTFIESARVEAQIRQTV